MTASSKRQKREDYRRTHKEEGGNKELPKKKFYRQRAHANPFSDHQLTYPISPSHMDWSAYYPSFVDPLAQPVVEGQPKPLRKPVTIADIGCGFGGLLVALSPMLPDELILGLEIRTQVTEYVQDRISALRSQHSQSVGQRRIIFPSYTVHKDAYTPVPIPNPSQSPAAKEYIIQSEEGIHEKHKETSEAQIKRILKLKTLPSYQDAKNRSTIWVAHLTTAQAEEIQKLAGIQNVYENKLDASDIQKGRTSKYYNPNPKTISPPPPQPYQNISVLRANTMKFLPNFFAKAQLSHIFLCFPDPHFKARKHKARIVSSTLCAEYAYVLRPGGCVYTITDVEELGNWMSERFAEFGRGGGDKGGLGMFERVEVPEEGEEQAWIEDGGEREGVVEWQGRNISEWHARREVGKLVRCIREETEEGKKVTRNGGKKFVGVWRRREDPKWPDED